MGLGEGFHCISKGDTQALEDRTFGGCHHIAAYEAAQRATEGVELVQQGFGVGLGLLGGDDVAGVAGRSAHP